MDFQQSQCQQVLQTMASSVRGKKFETTDGLPTISVQKSVETMARFSGEKSLKQRMEFQESQCKKALKLWLDF